MTSQIIMSDISNDGVDSRAVSAISNDEAVDMSNDGLDSRAVSNDETASVLKISKSWSISDEQLIDQSDVPNIKRGKRHNKTGKSEKRRDYLRNKKNKINYKNVCT